MKTVEISKPRAFMLELDLQLAVSAEVAAATGVPGQDAVAAWLELVLQDMARPVELTVRVVDEEESAYLNSTYRHKDGSTNVLSFPFEQPSGVDIDLLGDLVICAPVVAREAKEQGKALSAHWAHMVVHGCLHLMGYDHQTDAEAEVMEAAEVAILHQLGFPNPYVNN